MNHTSTAPRPSLRRRLVVALVGVLLLLTSACDVPVVGGHHTMTVTAYFDDTAGVFVGNDVGILGVTVGKITSITPEGTQVKVVMQVDTDHPVPAGAKAVVVARSVATDRYIELTPVYTSGPKMADGAVIPYETTVDGKVVKRTFTPVDFDDVLKALNTFATGISGSTQGVQAIRRIIDSGSNALDGRGPLLNSTIKRLAGAVGSVSGQRGDIAATLRSLDTLVATIAANQGTAREFIHQVSTAAQILNGDRVQFRLALQQLNEAAGTIATFAAKHRAQIQEVLGRGSTLMKAVLAKQRQLTSILDVFPLALQNVSRVSHDGRIDVRIAPTMLLPLGTQIAALCADLPLKLCSILNGTDPSARPTTARSAHRKAAHR